ncbi:hypothetical protein [Hydrocarboniphaga effusa]|uniref:hypothetical protein n=1 Tax=Hydrocarboniphaga effusa TaxID=243629 RepID=UPI0035AF4D68
MSIRSSRFTSERQRTPPPRPTHAPSTERRTLSISALIATVVASITLISAVLSLIGYGVALAVEVEFALPHASLFNSAFDLMELSTWSIIRMMVTVGNSISASPLYWKLLKQALWPLGIGALITVVAALIEWSPKARSWVQMVNEQRRRLSKLKASRTGRILLFGLSSSLTAAVLVPFTTILLPGVAVMMLAYLALIPMTSMSAAQGYIKEYVIAPTACVPRRTLEERTREPSAAQPTTTQKPPPAATCVALHDVDGKVVAAGRVVFSTSHAIVLFDPDSGSAECVRLDGLSVTAIDKQPSEKGGDHKPAN